ncbi:hypothetical protein JAAARDRAFT_524506 [Jaapia argillacea MUCL 33604]|uniref:Uncharacterized protein n=1 Tax=Jaapia argillacea MUCL 33604 TaxID=933084 RepID=A0A067QGX2_9AGAM|nr:hypothetical protein JAAARDRAFT_524506 [Jaapia argillacea MUCL 33604]
MIGGVAAGIAGLGLISIVVMYFMRKHREKEDAAAFSASDFRRQSVMISDEGGPSSRRGPRPPTMIERHMANAGGPAAMPSLQRQQGYDAYNNPGQGYGGQGYGAGYGQQGQAQYAQSSYNPGELMRTPSTNGPHVQSPYTAQPFFSQYDQTPLGSPVSVAPYGSAYNDQGQLIRQPSTAGYVNQGQLARQPSSVGYVDQGQLARQPSSAGYPNQSQLARQPSSAGYPNQSQLARQPSSAGYPNQSQLARQPSTGYMNVAASPITRQPSMGGQYPVITRQNSSGPHSPSVEGDSYVDLSRSSVTPFQAQQYEEISRKLGSEPPMGMPGVVEEDEYSQHPMSPPNHTSPFADPGANGSRAPSPYSHQDNGEMAMPAPPSPAYTSHSRITSNPPTLPEIEHNKGFSPVSMEFPNPSGGNAKSSPLAMEYKPANGSAGPQEPAGALTRDNMVHAQGQVSERKKAESVYSMAYDPEDAYGGI